jgi:acyl carrier protein
MAENSTDSVLVRFIKTLSAATGVEAAKLTLSTTLDEIVTDSLEYLNLVAALNTEFGKLPEEKLTEAETVGAFLKVVEDFGK